VYVVQVAQDTTAERRTLGVLTGVLLVGGLLAVLGAIAVGAFYADRALVPIRESLRRQREFAADASHELRTPLTVLRTAVEYVERHPEQRIGDMGEVVSDMHDEVEQMTALVGDLLLLARTDSGAVDVERVPLDLADVATDALSSVSTLAAAREVRLTLDPSPAPVLGDPQRLRQLVTILADNAISHSPPNGAVTVRVTSTGRLATLVVEDEGLGIRTADLPRVFDRFWRAPDAPTEGTGLGLAIAAWIVERHDGTIEAANRDGGGAVFSVRIPLDRSRTAGTLDA
jgi:signal transduction histidine kinase